MKLLSTTALSKSLGITPKELFKHFYELGYIEGEGDARVLSQKGRDVGGDYRESKQHGKYIVWPENLEIALPIEHVDKEASKDNIKLITASSIGEQYEISANKVNHILLELGLIKKGIKGWLLTDHGQKQGGVQVEMLQSGVPYVKWPEGIIDSKSLKETVNQFKGTDNTNQLTTAANNDEIGFRQKFEAKHRATDGHFVRSKAEMLIDNWLYMARIVHAYERKLPIEEDVYSDFYIPTGNVYIEYWGYENEQKYVARKNKKIELYEKYGFSLIQLQDEDVKNLDDVLPRLLLKFGVQAY